MMTMQEAFLSLMYPITVSTLEHFQGVAGQRQQRQKLDPTLMKALKRRDHLKRTGAAAAVTEEDARTAFKVGQTLALHQGWQLPARLRQWHTRDMT